MDSHSQMGWTGSSCFFHLSPHSTWASNSKERETSDWDSSGHMPIPWPGEMETSWLIAAWLWRSRFPHISSGLHFKRKGNGFLAGTNNRCPLHDWIAQVLGNVPVKNNIVIASSTLVQDHDFFLICKRKDISRFILLGSGWYHRRKRGGPLSGRGRVFTVSGDGGIMLTPRHSSGRAPACGSCRESLFALCDATATIIKKVKLFSGASNIHDSGGEILPCQERYPRVSGG